MHRWISPYKNDWTRRKRTNRCSAALVSADRPWRDSRSCSISSSVLMPRVALFRTIHRSSLVPALLAFPIRTADPIATRSFTRFTKQCSSTIWESNAIYHDRNCRAFFKQISFFFFLLLLTKIGTVNFKVWYYLRQNKWVIGSPCKKDRKKWRENSWRFKWNRMDTVDYSRS